MPKCVWMLGCDLVSGRAAFKEVRSARLAPVRRFADDNGRRVLIALTGCFGLVFAERASRADLVYFRKGGDAQLPATVAGDRIVLVMPEGGKVELFREDIVKRVPGFWPASEWASRRREARPGGFAARYAAVWWAIENGLTMEVAAELRELHAMDPKHGPTARMVALLDRLDRPCAGSGDGGLPRRRWGSRPRWRAGRT